ncbi:hypothetical protein TRFO_28927 [Tritrichomonas foetus]|uniref:Uncharacterized protein n=1 Tax=Tritrichomonas foetus TaxID=1144522 RepID=A0A1J4JWU3_9EUKA|nr:hypothetical protein TRFO_28927 [Tritrichomonas foetus]|eukprot:OHT03615.1 hypothetical protein TRFO_28927 [Tritrichomonas foetus]
MGNFITFPIPITPIINEGVDNRKLDSNNQEKDDNLDYNSNNTSKPEINGEEENEEVDLEKLEKDLKIFKKYIKRTIDSELRSGHDTTWEDFSFDNTSEIRNIADLIVAENFDKSTKKIKNAVIDS